MPAQKLSDGLYSVGVLNPNLRVFDIIMKTEFGTSYNAYVLKGAEKTVLFETVHLRFFDEYLENVKSVVPLDKIDYLVLNHTEPDHSGSVRRLLELAPQIEVISSMAANRFLQGITNISFQGRVVKDKDTLDIGGKTLEFLIAPFLHWPDSMFTYVKEDKTLFTCDFLGAHYCEPRVLDKHVMYPQDYEYSFDNYYTAIFSPFAEHVLFGLSVCDGLDVSMCCTSHGPVLTSGGRYEWAKELYRKYATPQPRAKKHAAVFYVSAYGATARVANEMADVARKLGYEVSEYDVIHSDPAILAREINTADALFIGSPTINRDALKPIWDLVSCIDAVNAKGRPVLVFGSYGWSGEGVPMLCERLKSLKLNVYENGYRVNFIPSDEELKKAREVAEAFLQTV